MIENRPLLTFFSHLLLIIGVAVVALPVYVTFVASTLAADEVLQSPMPMLPGSHLIENYAKVLSEGASTNVTTAPVARMAASSLSVRRSPRRIASFRGAGDSVVG